MCDCKTDIEAKLTERNADPSRGDVKAELQGYVLTLEGNTMKLRGAMPYSVRFFTVSKAGNKTRKTSTGQMIFSFCPFCGERIAAPSPAQGGSTGGEG